MLSAIVWGAVAPRPLASTLATLVPAAVDGALREVVVVGLSEGEESRAVADHAGCSLAPDAAPAEQAGRLKGAWVLLVRSGDRLPEDWLDVVDAHASRARGAARLPVERTEWPRWRYWLGWRPSAVLLARADAVKIGAATWTALASSSRGSMLSTGRVRRG